MTIGFIALEIQENTAWIKDNFDFPLLENEQFHHLTVAFKPSDELIQELTPKIGAEYTLKVTGYYSDNDINVLSVEDIPGLPIQNIHPHITVSCASGIKPVHSNDVLREHGTLPACDNLTLTGKLYFQNWS